MKPWDTFFREKIEKIFKEKKLIIDIGGGLRIDPTKNNRKKSHDWVDQYLPKVEYKIMDKVADYNPDIVGDIHNLPFANDSIDAIMCIAVLEHVEEPQKAVREMFRVLKPGGYCFIYVPFLYYYHPMKGYYGDFYRFTIDGLQYMTKDFKTVETQNVRGALATVSHLIPQIKGLEKISGFLDKYISKEKTNQTSGYHLFCIK